MDIVSESIAARLRRYAFPVPDALLAFIYLIFAVAHFFPHYVPHAMFGATEGLGFALIVEGAFLFGQGTLVDVATRLKKRPPIWLVPFILGGVILFVGNQTGAWEVIKAAWSQGTVAFLPLLLSLIERGVMLWQMPTRTTTQKMAARALISNRIITALVLGILFAIASLALGLGAAWPVMLAGALYFAIAAYDDIRVRRPAFAANPKVLFRYDVLGVKYLEPL
ncbi:MAG TPA: hypothetical protein VNI54_10975 [Thermoanaerobaculia bacterium]|nr:hypothetical protein [Thermoanaerobaculia bacterium]